MSEFDDRVKVSKLVKDVLIGRLTAREAILNFPPDCEDKSIVATSHALVHFEADADLRHRDPLYKDEQDEYLEFIMFTLEKGDALPDNIIRSYDSYYQGSSIPHTDDKKGFWKSFLKFLNVK